MMTMTTMVMMTMTISIMTMMTIMMIMIVLPWKDGRINWTSVLIDDRERRPRVLRHCHAVPEYIGEEEDDEDDCLAVP